MEALERDIVQKNPNVKWWVTWTISGLNEIQLFSILLGHIIVVVPVQVAHVHVLVRTCCAITFINSRAAGNYILQFTCTCMCTSSKG